MHGSHHQHSVESVELAVDLVNVCGVVQLQAELDCVV